MKLLIFEFTPDLNPAINDEMDLGIRIKYWGWLRL